MEEEEIENYFHNREVRRQSVEDEQAPAKMREKMLKPTRRFSKDDSTVGIGHGGSHRSSNPKFASIDSEFEHQQSTQTETETESSTSSSSIIQNFGENNSTNTTHSLQTTSPTKIGWWSSSKSRLVGGFWSMASRDVTQLPPLSRIRPVFMLGKIYK